MTPDQRFDDFDKDRFRMVFATVYLLTSDPATAENATRRPSCARSSGGGDWPVSRARPVG